jgi:hypothetical protein
VLDPAEINLGLEKPSLFEDFESSRRIYIDPAAARADYLKKLEDHCGALRQTCRKLGIGYHLLSTAQPLEIALFEFLQGRMRRGRQIRRQGAMAGGAT